MCLPCAPSPWFNGCNLVTTDELLPSVAPYPLAAAVSSHLQGMGVRLPARSNNRQVINWDLDFLQLHYKQYQPPRLHIHGMCEGACCSSSCRIQTLTTIFHKGHKNQLSRPPQRQLYGILQADHMKSVEYVKKRVVRK